MSRRQKLTAQSGMMTKPMPFSAIVSVDDIEDEQTRVFTRMVLESALHEEPPRHRYLAIAIPAFLDDEEEERATESEASWPRTFGLVAWGCTLSIIGAALFVAAR